MLALVFATRKECSAALPTLKTVPRQGGFTTAVIHDRNVVVLVTGIASINAALHMGRLFGSKSGIQGVVNIGVAGTLSPQELPLCATCVASTEICPEYGLYSKEGFLPQGIGFSQWEGPTGDVFDRLPLSPEDAASAMGLTLPEGWTRVPMLSVSGVSGTEGRLAELAARYPDARGENMEGFAVALACAQMDIPFLEIRAISNCVGSREAKDWRLDDALKLLPATVSTLFSAP